LFRRLALFTGSFSLEAIESICAGWQTADDLVHAEIFSLFAQLVEKSLVVAEERGRETRYRLLETIREYALEKLQEADELERGRTRHVAFFCDLAESVGPKVNIAWPASAIERLNREYANIVAALEWTAAHPACAENGLRLVGALPEEWYMRKALLLSESGLRQLFANPDITISNKVLAKALVGLGCLAFFRFDILEAFSSFERSLALSRDFDDKAVMAYALYNLGFLWSEMNDMEKSRGYLEECLAICRAIGDHYGVAVTLQDLGYTICWQGDSDKGRSLIEESRASLQQHDIPTWAARAALYLGQVFRREGDFSRARSLFLEFFNIFRDPYARPFASCFSVLAFGFLAAAEGRYERAVQLLGALERMVREVGTALSPLDLVEHDAYIAAARDTLGETRFKEVWDAGQRLGFDEAVAYAISVDNSATSDEPEREKEGRDVAALSN
jgi:tetratricopeptide (TPR) repeat protein